MHDLDMALLRRGAELFNDAKYFEAHEVWEDDWRHRQRGALEWHFLKALIDFAAGMHHWTRDNGYGMDKLLRLALTHIAGAEGVWPIDLVPVEVYIRRAVDDPTLPERERPLVHVQNPE